MASVVQEELVEEGDSDRQSHMSGISQQDRDNKTILLRQAASGKLFKILGKYREAISRKRVLAFRGFNFCHFKNVKQDRDNKTILPGQAASGKLFKILEKYRDYYKGSYK